MYQIYNVLSGCNDIHILSLYVIFCFSISYFLKVTFTLLTHWRSSLYVVFWKSDMAPVSKCLIYLQCQTNKQKTIDFLTSSYLRSASSAICLASLSCISWISIFSSSFVALFSITFIPLDNKKNSQSVRSFTVTSIYIKVRNYVEQLDLQIYCVAFSLR